MGIKKFFGAVAYGAAVALGSIIAVKGVEAASDPYKQVAIRNKLKNFKNKLLKK